MLLYLKKQEKKSKNNCKKPQRDNHIYNIYNKTKEKTMEKTTSPSIQEMVEVLQELGKTKEKFSVLRNYRTSILKDMDLSYGPKRKKDYTYGLLQMSNQEILIMNYLFKIYKYDVREEYDFNNLTESIMNRKDLKGSNPRIQNLYNLLGFSDDIIEITDNLLSSKIFQK